MMFQVYFKKDNKQFVQPFYKKHPVKCFSGTIYAYNPPGYISPYNKNNRDKFFAKQIARKYTVWETLNDPTLIMNDKKNQILNKNSSYVIDPCESY